MYQLGSDKQLTCVYSFALLQLYYSPIKRENIWEQRTNQGPTAIKCSTQQQNH